MKHGDRSTADQGDHHEAYTILRGERAAASGVILLCDHASNALPEGFGTLGLPACELARHIGYDIGAAMVTRAMSRCLDAPALLTRYSRLLVDCNRGYDDPTLVMRLSDGAVIPGNRDLSTDDIAARIDRYWRPYHDAIEAVIDGTLAAGTVPVLVSIHSFTPVWKDFGRPWHAAVLWDRDPRLKDVVLDGLRTEPDLVVGDNEPYNGRLHGDCLYRHGTRRGLAHVLIEVRQDLIAGEAGALAWGERLARILTRALADPVTRADLQSIRHYGSHTDDE